MARVPKPRLSLVAALMMSTYSLGCQASNLTLPGDAAPARVHALSGSGQQGTIGEELPEPLVVQVTDAAGRPVPGASLDFFTEVPEAELDRAAAITDESGKAWVRVLRLGSVEGLQVVEARLADDGDLRAMFTLTAVAEDDHGRKDRRKGGGKGDDDHDHHDHD